MARLRLQVQVGAVYPADALALRPPARRGVLPGAELLQAPAPGFGPVQRPGLCSVRAGNVRPARSHGRGQQAQEDGRWLGGLDVFRLRGGRLPKRLPATARQGAPLEVRDGAGCASEVEEELQPSAKSATMPGVRADPVPVSARSRSAARSPGNRPRSSAY